MKKASRNIVLVAVAIAVGLGTSAVLLRLGSRVGKPMNPTGRALHLDSPVAVADAASQDPHEPRQRADDEAASSGNAVVDSSSGAEDPAPLERWLAEWRAGRGDLEQGLQLARARKTWLEKTICKDPHLAYQHALDAETWSSLPKEMQGELARRFSGRGEYHVATDCETYNVWRNLTMQDLSTGHAAVVPELAGRETFTGTIKGVALGHQVGVVAMEGDSILPQNLEAPSEPPPVTAEVTGNFKVLWLNIKFSDETSYPSEGTSLSAAATKFDEYSYGRMTLLYDAVAVGISATKASNPSDSTIQSQAKTAAQALGYNSSNYNTIMYRQSLKGQYAGLSGTPGYVMVSKSVLETNVHEIAHTMGMHHANWWKPNTGEPSWGAGVNDIYGEEWDAMSYNNPRGDFNLAEKVQLGWVTSSTDYIQNVTNGTYRIYNHLSNSRAAFSTTGVNGAYFGATVYKDTTSINGGNGPRIYMISYRDRSSFGSAKFSPGVSLHWQRWTNIGYDPFYGTTGTGNAPYGSNIIDTLPGSANNVYDSHLAIGKTYIDNAPGNRDGPIHITALKKNDPDGTPGNGDESVDVKVVVGTQTGNSPPTGTLALSKQLAAPGEAVTMTVTASDPNGDTLAYHWDFGLGTTVANLTAMATDGASTQQFSYSAAGTYIVTVTVSDCRGGSIQLTKTMNIVDTPPDINVTATDAAAAEATTANPGVFTLTRTGATAAALTVNYTLSGTAINGTDYTSLTGAVTFAANSATATVTVTPTNDTEYENSEDVTLTLSPSVVYFLGASTTATVTIADNDKPTISVAGTVTAASEAGPVNGLLTFTRTGWTGLELNVPIAITGTALGGSDYTALPTSITFAANSSTATFSVPVINDTDFELAETVIVTISTNAAYTVASSPNHTSTVTISDNDKPTVTVAVTDAACLETSSNDGVFTLTRTGTTVAALTVKYTLTGAAINGTDYTLRTGSVIFAANGATATVSIDPIDDSEYEDHETVTLNISPDTAYIVGAASSDSLTITDNDKPTVSVTASTTTLTEGGSGSVLTFTRSGINSLGSLTVFYAPSGTAIIGSDYSYMTGTIIIPQGQASATVNVNILQDDVTEAPETLIVTASTNTAYNVALAPNNAANLTVLDDNEAVAVNIAVTDATASEPSKGDGTGLYTITRSGSTTAALSVKILASGTATQGSDYSTLPSTVTIPAGQTSATVTITPTDDTEAEVDEIVTVTLQAGSGYSIGATSAANINLYDDEATQVRVEVSDALCHEAATVGTGAFLLRRLGDRTAALTVNYTRTGTATSGSDFTALTSPATISAGGASVTVTVTPINDTLVEGTETVILTLATGTGYTINTQNSGTLEIRDDETVDVTISAQEPNCAEQSTPDTGNFRITRSVTAATPLTVSYTIAGTANNGTDYTTISGTATILANAAYADILITPTNDGILEGSESIILTLSGAVSTYDIGDARNATIWIKDDDTPSITLAATDATAAEADGGSTNQGLYTFTSSFAPASNLTINYTVSTNNGIECSFLPGSIVLSAGQTSVTLAVVPIDDELVEAAENITLTLAYGGSYNLITTAGVNVSIAASDTPVATITAFDPNAVENPVKTGRFIVTLSKVVAGNTTVNYTLGGTATSGSDFTALTGTVTVGTGANSAIITVTPFDDVLSEGPETVSLTLASSASYTVGSPSVATVTIADDEVASALTAYKQTYFGSNWNNEAIAGDTVDYDLDGLNNLLEYAFGSNPALATESEVPQSSTASGSLSLTFNRVVAHNDITIVIQAADDLNNTWSDIASCINGSPTVALSAGVVVTETGTGSTRSVSVTDLCTTNDPAHPRRFMRIKVSQ